MSAPDAATVAAVLAEHVSQVGPISGAWHCPCGAVSSNGHIGAGNLTTRAERTAEFCDHLAAALLASEPIAQALAAVEAVARVEALLEGATQYVEVVARIHEVYRSLVMDTPEDRRLHAKHVEIADKALALARRDLASLGNSCAALRPEGGNQ